MMFSSDEWTGRQPSSSMIFFGLAESLFRGGPGVCHRAVADVESGSPEDGSNSLRGRSHDTC